MKIKILVFSLTFSIGTFLSFPFKAKPLAVPSAEPANFTSNEFKPVRDFPFRTLHGYIGDQNVSMKLRSYNARLSGYYWTRNGRTSIPIQGSMDRDGTFVVQEFSFPGARSTGWLRGTWEEDTDDLGLFLRGHWSASEADTKEQEFYLSEQLFDCALPIATTSIQREDADLHLALDIDIPRIATAAVPKAEAINTAIRAAIDHEVSDHRGFIREIPVRERSTEPSGSYFNANYRVFFANDELVSIVIKIEVYRAGAATSYRYMKSLAFDLKTGRRIELAELFGQRSAYLQLISQSAVEVLKKRLNMSPEDEDSWLEKGTAPTANNYQTWAISKRGLVIGFDQYSIASGGSGIQCIRIPWSELAELIDSQGPIAGLY